MHFKEGSIFFSSSGSKKVLLKVLDVFFYTPSDSQTLNPVSISQQWGVEG